jgi:hypothetical protein
MFVLTPDQRRRIGACSELAEETIRRIEQGKRTTEASRLRFERACAELGIVPTEVQS